MLLAGLTPKHRISTMRVINLTIALSLSAVLCFPLSYAVEASDKSAEQLLKLGDEYYFEQARFDPISNATSVGDGRYDDQLNISISPAERNKHFEKLHAIQNELSHLHRNSLGTEDALTYDVLDDELRESLGAEHFPDHLLPITQMDAMPVTLASYGSGQSDQPLKSVANYDAYLKRISLLPSW